MSFERPPSKQNKAEKVSEIETPKDVEKKLEVAQPEAVIEPVLNPESTFMGRNATLEKATDGTPLEFRKSIGSLVDRMKGLKAVSRKEATQKSSGPIQLDGKGTGTFEKPVAGLLLTDTEPEAFPHRLEKEAANEAAKNEQFKNVSRAVELAKKAGVHESHTKTHELEEKYLQAYKKSHSSGKPLSNLKNRNEFIKIKNEYDSARLEHAQALQKSLADRLDTPERSTKLKTEYEKMLAKEKTEGIHGLRDSSGRPLTFEAFKKNEDEKLLHRYNGWIRYKEVFKPTHEAKERARVENLGEKGKSLLGKAVNRYQEANTWLEEKVGPHGARAVRLLVATTAATGFAMTFGGIGFAGAGAFAASKLLRGALSTFGGTALGAAAGKGFVETIGKDDAKQLKASHGKEIHNLKDLKQHQSIQKHGSAEGIESNRRTVEMTVAILAGLGLSHAAATHAAQLQSVQKAAGVVAHGGGGTIGNGGEGFPGGNGGPGFTPNFPTHEQMVGLGKGDAHGHYFYENRPNASAGHEVVVDAKINDANKLIGHFAEKLQHDYHGVDADHTPKSVQAYLALFKTHDGASLLQGENHASMELGLRGHHGLSEIMHPGDSVELNNQGQVVIHWADHARVPHVLVDAEGGVNMDTDDLAGSHVHAVHHGEVHHATAESGATQPAAHAENAPTESTSTPVDPSDALNQDQVAKGVTYNADLQSHLHPSHPEVAPDQPAHEISHESSTSESVYSANVETHENPTPLVQHIEAATNPNGVVIDPSKPQMYAWKLPDQRQSLRVFYGSDESITSKTADAFLAKHSDIPYVFVAHEENGQLIPQMHMQQNGLGTAVGYQGTAFNPETDTPLPPINVNQFIKYPDNYK